MTRRTKPVLLRSLRSSTPAFRLAGVALALQFAFAGAHAQDRLLSVDRPVYASSVHDNNMPDLAVDGSLQSRWESAWGKDGQWLYVDLGAGAHVSRVVINWEGAYARNYELQASDDEVHWNRVYATPVANQALVNEIPLDVSARFLRLVGTERNNPAYGYSVYEFSVYGTGGAGSGVAPAPDIAAGRPAVASSQEVDQDGAPKELTPRDYLATNVTDGELGSRWSSVYGDKQWIYVDLGQSTTIGAVEFDWQNAFGRAYDIQVSDNAVDWTSVYRTLASPGGNDRVPLYATGRYVRMLGIARATSFGYSMLEFKVFPWRDGDPKPSYTLPQVPATPTRVAVGKGSYEADDITQLEPPPPTYKTDAIKGPIPSNDWWQHLLIANFGNGNSLVTHPLRSSYSRNGLGVTTLDAGYLSTDGKSVDTGRDTDLYIRPVNLLPSKAVTKVAGYGDYHVDVVLSDDATPKMTTTLVQGSPYVFNTFANPDKVQITSYNLVRLFDRAGNTILANDFETVQGDVVGMEVLSTDKAPQPKTSTRYYGVFAPAGSTFMRIGNAIKVTLPTGQEYLSVATMPQAADLNDFQQHAYAFVTGTKADYKVDLASSQVRTDFTTTTTLKRSGFSNETMMGLLPHQWKLSGARLDGRLFPTVRGDLKLMTGNGFQTLDRFHGLIPQFVEPTNPEYSRAKLAGYLDQLDQSTAGNPLNDDPYWQGKALHPLAMGIIVADQIGDANRRDRYVARLRGIFADWLNYDPNETLHGTYFHYVKPWGSLVTYHTGFGLNTGLTDHHFTYGYFTFAAGVLANYDKAFVKDYGPMVDMLIRDYANPSRTDTLFPYMRNFNAYSGHSWAGGFGDNASGNNQEAAGEALVSWLGQYLWGLATGNDAYRDAGIYGFTTEEKAIEQYWFNYDQDNWLPNYTHGTVGQVYDAANAFITYFNGDPTYVYGIHWCPTAEWLTYYGRDPAKAARLYGSFSYDNGGVETDWQHILWPMQSLSDAKGVLAKWDATKVQASETFNTYWFVNAMASLGQRSNDIFAVGWPAATVYKGAGGYKAQVWNPTDVERTVQFSDGSAITGSAVVPAHATIAVDPTRVVTTAPVLPAPVDPYLATAGWSVDTFSANGEPVANMLDGDQNTRWSSGQTQVAGQWVAIDLKESKTFDTLFVSAGNTGDYLRGYEIYVSADGKDWGKAVASGAGEASLALSLGTQTARFVKIVNTATSDRWWSITEVKVANFGSPATPTQPAEPALPPASGTFDRAGWQVRASSAFERDPITNAIDASRDTIWSSGAPQQPGQWIQVDMGSSRTLDSVTVDAAGRDGDYPHGLNVYVSEDGSDWGQPVFSADALASQRIAATFAPAKGRYLHIEQTGSAQNWWSVAELNAAWNGLGALSEIARDGWSASASSSGEPAARAIDGQAATRWTSGLTQQPGQWFQVDLGASRTVKQIDLDANSGDWPRAWEVRLSDDGATWSEPVASGTGKDAYLSIPLGKRTARFIRVLQTGSGDAWWSVAEAKVFE
jgi:endoglucanase Acf2